MTRRLQADGSDEQFHFSFKKKKKSRRKKLQSTFSKGEKEKKLLLDESTDDSSPAPPPLSLPSRHPSNRLVRDGDGPAADWVTGDGWNDGVQACGVRACGAPAASELCPARCDSFTGTLEIKI